MKKYNLLLAFMCTIITSSNSIFSCPCSSSPKNERPFFEDDEQSNDENTNDKEESE